MEMPVLNAPQSKILFDRARKVMPSGYTRQMAVQSPHPVYAAEADGCWITDVEGTRRVDYVNNFTALIHGHNQPEILAALNTQAGRLMSSIMPTESEIQLAELLCERIPSCDEVRFMNSGTEAVMMAVKAARAYTGKPRIAKMEGGYHGQFDLTETSFQPLPDKWGAPEAPASVANAQGTPQSVLDEVLILPFNNIEATRHLLRSHADELSMVILCPFRLQLGLVEPQQEYIAMLRDECSTLGILLVFDEVMCLRTSYHGTQGLRGITPDLTTMGKIIGGGLPIGALGGSREVMSVFSVDQGDPKVKHSGTFTANPLSMHVGYVSMKLLDRAAFDRLELLGQRLCEGLEKICFDLGVEAYVEGTGSLAAMVMHERRITNWRELFDAAAGGLLHKIEVYQRLLMDEGLSTMRGGFVLSTPMDEDVIDFTLHGVRRALNKMQAQ